jgi:AcrR family transcriptional regulator
MMAGVKGKERKPQEGARRERRPRGRPSAGAREALVRAARELFTERDFNDVSTGEILARAGVSRGAMYHHFPSKTDLFRAVYLASERDAMQRVAAAARTLMPSDDPFDLLIAGCRAYLAECASSRELQRIGLRQSRAVLGWEAWREAAADLGIGLMEATVAAAAAAGEIDTCDVAATSSVLLAGMIEAGLAIANDPEPQRARVRFEPELVRLVEGLRRAGPR